MSIYLPRGRRELRHYDKQAFNQEKAQVLPDYELHVDLRNEASFEALVWL